MRYINNKPILDYPRYAWQLLGGFRARHERAMHDARTRDIASLLPSGQPLRVLDVANGSLRPQYALLNHAGHAVYGVDWVNRPGSIGSSFAYRAARSVYAHHQRVPRADLNRPALLCGDVDRLPFPDSFFDLATSIAAFEHFLDIPSVLAELHRVLRPGGIVWTLIHLFTSPSGGHNVNFTEYPLRTLRPGYEPWDHLRQRRLPFSVPLNEWRQAQYLAAFAERFEIIQHYCYMREGEQWLKPTVQRELAGYTADELTCAAYVIVARKVKETA